MKTRYSDSADGAEAPSANAVFRGSNGPHAGEMPYPLPNESVEGDQDDGDLSSAVDEDALEDDDLDTDKVTGTDGLGTGL